VKINARPAMLIMLSIFGILLFLSSLCSCTSCSESGRRANAQKPTSVNYIGEKVVILEDGISRESDDVTITWYKVKRINHGVVTHIKVIGGGKFAVTDTIYWKF
jgi:hypothetical protein